MTSPHLCAGTLKVVSSDAFPESWLEQLLFQLLVPCRSCIQLKTTQYQSSKGHTGTEPRSRTGWTLGINTDDDLLDEANGRLHLLRIPCDVAQSVRPRGLVVRPELDPRPRLLLNLLDHLPSLAYHYPNHRTIDRNLGRKVKGR